MSLGFASQLDLTMALLFDKFFLLFGALVSLCFGDNVKKHPLYNITITNYHAVKAYQSNLECAQQRLSEPLNLLSNVVTPIETDMV